MNKILCGVTLFLAFFTFNTLPVSASDEHEVKDENFNPGILIMDHIGDSHGWHLFGDVSIPLPVIIYKPGNGLHIFSSSRFHHGTVPYDGFRLNEKNKIESEDGSEIYDLSITKNVASLLFVIVLMLLVFISIAKRYSTNKNSSPKGLQSWVEPVIVFVRDEVAKSSIGEKKYEKYMPFLLTVFFFILFLNLLGLIPIAPGGANVTGNIAVTMSLALLTFIITLFSANKNYWHHIFAMPGVPVWVLFLLTPIEILGVFLRPFVLMIRLFANIMAGHIVALSFFSLIFIFGKLNIWVGYGTSVVSVAFTIFMSLMELLVAFLQAYVFTLLSAIYFGAAVEEHANHEHPPHAGVNEHIEEAAVV
jgi:F-type H+-transporting ATPase subunit a